MLAAVNKRQELFQWNGSNSQWQLTATNRSCQSLFRIISRFATALIAPSDMLHLIFGTSFLHQSVVIIYPPVSDLHLNMLV